MLGARLGRGLGLILGAGAFAIPAHAQARAWTEDEPPPGYNEALARGAQEVRRLPGRAWPELEALSDADLDAQDRQLKIERKARVRALAGIGEEIRQLDERLRKKLSEPQRKKIAYRRALLNYRVAVEERQVRLISGHLKVLNAQRARRRGDPEPGAPGDPTAPENVRQAKAAVELLAKYDEALQQVLRREPFTEADVIYALGLLNEKAQVQTMLSEYMGLLETHTGAAEAATAPAAEAGS